MGLNIFQEYWERFKKPWCIAFSLYLVFVIIILGGLGVLFSIFSSLEMNDTMENVNMKQHMVSSNLSTYSIALLIPAVISILLSFYELKNKVSSIILSVIIVLLSVALLVLSINKEAYSIYAAIFSFLLALFFWVIANHDNDYLNDAAFEKVIKNDMKQNHNKDGEWDNA